MKRYLNELLQAAIMAALIGAPFAAWFYIYL